MAAAYFSPTHLDEALALLAERPRQLVAGGTDHFPARGRAPVTQDIVDLTRLAGLRGIRHAPDGGTTIGATTTWTDIIRAELPPAFDGLKAAAREVGSVQIQNAGTVAGNLCNASPAADGVPALLTLDAKVEIAGPGGTRQLALPDFIRGPRQTALDPGELVVAIHVPAVPAQARSAFQKAGARKYLVISIAMTAVLVVLDNQRRIAQARVAVGSCSAVALRLTRLERDLIGQPFDQIEISADHLTDLAPISDIRADATYRSEIVPHQIRRAILEAGAAHG